MSKVLMLYTVLHGEKIFYASCPNKGPLEENENYAKCEQCATTYHPSCGEKADLRDDGSFRKCCPEKDFRPDHSNKKLIHDDIIKLATDDASKNDRSADSDSDNSIVSYKTNDDLDATDDLLTQMRKLMKGELERSTSNIKNNIDMKTEAISSKIDKLSERVDDLEHDIDDLNSRVTVLESAKHNHQIELNDILVDEIKERIYRERNVIIFGIQESEDPLYLTQVLQNMLNRAPFNLQDIQFFRIRNQNGNTSRPVELILQSADHAKWIIRNQRKICDGNIRRSSDKTHAQQQYIHNLMLSLEERKKRGEKDIVIKSINGTPTIVKFAENKSNASSIPTKRNGNNAGHSHQRSTSQMNRSSSYIPPILSSSNEEFVGAFEKISAAIDKAVRNYPSAELMVAGDFNLPGFSWQFNNNIVYASGTSNNLASDLGVSALELLVNQCNVKKVFGAPNYYGNYLDLIFSSLETAS
ncbi:hypothetical protein QAD02_021687 [Eretmocerus hayati]|uniref:Uncharacterized protein n=1 Tax=Eretmocerus hayati TaxID=131215 RepID=A0ACC2PTF2_9HYME|nr:hypothetical protein QAD02_021687 [Eretmocerus hayati]